MARRKFTLIVLLITAPLLFSCWYYSFSGRALPDVDSVAIPLFKDNTLEFQLKERLQLALIQTFQEENILKIEGEGTADSILDGVIVSVVDRPTSVTKNEQTEQTEVRINIQIKFENKKTGKVLLNEQVSGVGFYQAVSERGTAIDTALEQLTREITDKILSGW